MACRCKHMQQEIEEYRYQIDKLRSLFIDKMTKDSETHDARRRDFNQAIFGYEDNGETYAIWSETTMDMVLTCFDNAVKEWRRTFIDNAPTVDVQEVRHGKWLKKGGKIECSECGAVNFLEPNYCPNCGTKMDGKEDKNGETL